MLETPEKRTATRVSDSRRSAPTGMPPDWFVAAMPHGYQTRLAEIQRLTDELKEIDRFGRVLLEIGSDLGEVIRDIFTSMRLEVSETVPGDPSNLAVKLDAKRRLLVSASMTDGAIERKSAEVARVFNLLHEHAGTGDRVVLVVNNDRLLPPGERGSGVAPDALVFLHRLAVNVVTGPSLFALWTQSMQQLDHGLKGVERLYAQDGGAFHLQTY